MASVLRLHDALQRNPIISIPRSASLIGASQPTVTKAIKKLEALAVVREVTGTNYVKIYAYASYLDILNDES
jgi:Fic family protein